MLYIVFKLQIPDKECDKNAIEQREYYAKIAMLMFYPFQNFDDLQLNGSYWKLFFQELQFFKRMKALSCGRKGLKFCRILRIEVSFNAILPRGLIILQNTQSTNIKSKERGASSDENKDIVSIQM